MANFGKKILSAFVEVRDEENPAATSTVPQQHKSSFLAPVPAPGVSEKFTHYFDKLFAEANLPGPDYYEFAKMIQAMTAIADEKARFSAAFAGLSAQGLDKNKLLETAAAYVKVLDMDANQFNSTVDAALQEKVNSKLQQIEDKQHRISELGKEIIMLQEAIATLKNEVKENEEKIENNTGGYRAALEKMKQQILGDIEKMKQYIM